MFDNLIFILATNIFDETMKVKVESGAGVEFSTICRQLNTILALNYTMQYRVFRG